MLDPVNAGKVPDLKDLLPLREPAYRLAVRLSTTTDAEDIVHDSYVRAMQATNIPPNPEERRFWFLRIVVNVAHSNSQKEKSRRVREQGAAMMANSMDSQTYGPEQAAQGELISAVHSALQSLDARHRSAICLHYEQGFTYDEAAKVLDVPAGSLRSYASQGIRKLREILEHRGHTLTETALCGLIVAGLPLELPAALAKSVELLIAQGTTAASAKGLVVTSQAGVVGIGLKMAAILLLAICGGSWYVLASKPSGPVVELPTQPPVAAKVDAVPTPVQVERKPVALMTEAMTLPPRIERVDPVAAHFENTPNWLESVHPEEHTILGAWSKSDGDIVCKPSAYARLCVPYHPGEVYDLYLEFTRDSGVADINVMLPYRGRTLLWKMGTQGNTEFQFKGVTAPQRIPRRNPAIKDGVRNTLLLEVRRDNVTATLNGELLLRENLNVNLAGEAAWNLPDQSAIGLGTWQTAARFHRLHVKTLEGTAHTIARDTSGEQIAKDEYWKGARDLLAVDPKLLNIPEGWVIVNGAATSDNGKFSKLDLNYAAPEEYDLRSEVVRNKGRTDVTFLLARPGKSFCLKLGTWGNFAHALDTIHGRVSGESPAAVNGRLDNGKSYIVVVQVRKKFVKVFLDNALIIHWPTDFNEFSIESNWAIQNGNIGIGSYEGSTTFTRVQIKELSAPPTVKTNTPPASEF